MEEPRKFTVKKSEIGKEDRLKIRKRRLIMKRQFQSSAKRVFFRQAWSPRLRINEDDLLNEVNVRSKMNIDNYRSSVADKQDPMELLPKTIYIYYCKDCQSYSLSSGGSCWIKAPLDSPLLIKSILRKLRLICGILRLQLMHSWSTKLHEQHTSIGLKLRSHASFGIYENVHNVVSILAYKTCPSCSPLKDETRLTVVKLRQYAASHKTTLRSLEQHVLSNPIVTFNIQKINHTDHGMDFFLTNERDAIILYYFFKGHAPVKDDEFHKSSDDNPANCQRFISATVCPICKDDLVQLPPKFTPNFLGHQPIGPLAICTCIHSTVFFIDPITLEKVQFTASEYWRQPFEPLKTSKDLVEYIVHEVKIISRERLYLLAEMRVARVLDSGMSDMPVSVRSHLGKELKPGDHALGYDLSDIDIEHYDNMKVPPVILVKKYGLATRHVDEVSRKKASPEYEQFLKDLEKNPETMFNLSLKDGDAKKQISETSSDKPQTSEIDLEDLLADLSLGRE